MKKPVVAWRGSVMMAGIETTGEWLTGLAKGLTEVCICSVWSWPEMMVLTRQQTL